MADESLVWELKVDADASGATRMDNILKALDGTTKLLDFHLSHIEENTRKSGKTSQEHAKHTETLTDALQNLVKKGLEPAIQRFEKFAEFEFVRESVEKLMELPGELAEKIVDLGEEMLNAAGKAQRFDAAFKNALGKEGGEQQLEYIEKVSKHTELTQQQAKSLNLELGKAGFKGGDVARGFEAAIDLGSMTDDPAAGAREAVSALARIRATGKIQSRALVPFGINEDDLRAEMSKETGLSAKGGPKSQVDKAMSEGRISVETEINSLYTAITTKTGKALGAAGADMENLYTTRLKNLKEIPDLIEEKMKSTNGFSEISDFVGNLADKLDVNGEIGSHIVDGLGAVFDRVGNMLKEVDLDGILQQGLNILEEMPDAVESITKTFSAMYDTVKPVADAIGYVADKILGPSGTSFEDVEASRSEVVEELVSRRLRLEQQARKSMGANFPVEEGPQLEGRKRLDALRKEASDALTKSGTLDAAAKAMGDSYVSSMRERVSARAGDLQRAGESVGNETVKGTRSALKMHSPSRVMEELADNVVDSFANRIEDGSGRAASALSGLVTSGGRHGGGIGASHIALTVAPHITIGAGAGPNAQEIADAVASRVASLTVAELQGALEQMAMSTGSAAP